MVPGLLVGLTPDTRRPEPDDAVPAGSEDADVRAVAPDTRRIEVRVRQDRCEAEHAGVLRVGGVDTGGAHAPADDTAGTQARALEAEAGAQSRWRCPGRPCCHLRNWSSRSSRSWRCRRPSRRRPGRPRRPSAAGRRLRRGPPRCRRRRSTGLGGSAVAAARTASVPPTRVTGASVAGPYACRAPVTSRRLFARSLVPDAYVGRRFRRHARFGHHSSARFGASQRSASASGTPFLAA